MSSIVETRLDRIVAADNRRRLYPPLPPTTENVEFDRGCRDANRFARVDHKLGDWVATITTTGVVEEVFLLGPSLQYLRGLRAGGCVVVGPIPTNTPWEAFLTAVGIT